MANQFDGLTPEQRFWAKVDKTVNCWNWTAGTDAFGYGELSINRKKWRAHRRAWVMVNGAIPNGVCVLHRCDNPACVKPEHLFLGNRLNNAQDRKAKGRNGDKRGVKNPTSKLTEAQVMSIRKDSRNTVELSKAYGVGDACIGKIKRRVSWSHLANA